VESRDRAREPPEQEPDEQEGAAGSWRRSRSWWARRRPPSASSLKSLADIEVDIAKATVQTPPLRSSFSAQPAEQAAVADQPAEPESPPNLLLLSRESPRQLTPRRWEEGRSRSRNNPTSSDDD
jgi:hypothetical protein